MARCAGQSELASIIVPVFNAEEYLGACFGSIAAQDHENLEVIFVDDGSTDGSAVVCDEFARRDPRVKVVHRENRGVSAARNAGLSASTGRYILFVDADDRIAQDHVSCLVSALENKGAQISTGTGAMSDYDGRDAPDRPLRSVDSRNAVEMLLCYRFPVQVWGKAYLRSLLVENDISFPEDISIGEDFVFNVRAFQASETVAVTRHRTYFQCKVNPNSATTRFDPERWGSGLRAMDVIKSELIRQTPEVMAAWGFANWRTHSDAYDLMVLSHSEERCPEMYEKCLEVTRGQALKALGVPVSFRDKLRALAMWICPKSVPWAMVLRRKVKGAEVSTQSWAKG